jgi:allantoicase
VTHLEFTDLPDLAARELGGSVVAANDELYAERENLIRPEPPVFAPDDYGLRGKRYDGWETRRRRVRGNDWAIARLGAAGIVHGVVVDTAHFRGNYPPEVSVEATSVEGYPSIEEVLECPWETIVARSPAKGDALNAYPVADTRRWTHLRLSIYPDGGVARLRVHGEVVPDPRLLTGTVDLAELENGGALVACSDAFYSATSNLIRPGRARSMAEGWETARRRDDGNDYATFRLAGAGLVRQVEVDTSYFVGNAPGWARLSSVDPPPDSVDGWDVLPRTRVQPDTRHVFVVTDPRPVTHVRLDVYPDGGLARLRVRGELTDAALAGLRQRWWDALPRRHQQLIPDQAP